jgi:geranylgeranyl diphosphate synthase type II
MHTLQALQEKFELYFERRHFPKEPSSLYEPTTYFLGLGGKRIRPLMCLMGNELFEEILPDAYPLATAVELFHNFTLIHDDIMDKAPLRRGKQTVHARYGEPTALLGGDVMLVVAYDYLNRIDSPHLKRIMHRFNRTAMEVCEGQQLDMDFEHKETISLDEYIQMIGLKTSVLLAASLEMGAMLGGAGEANCHHLYQFGKKLGIAFQIQDDYLDAFGDPEKFGKQVGGDIMANKKTFLMIHAMESADEASKEALKQLMTRTDSGKVGEVLNIFRNSGVDAWALELKQRYMDEAAAHLEDIAVTKSRKSTLEELMHYLIKRDR